MRNRYQKFELNKRIYMSYIIRLTQNLRLNIMDMIIRLNRLRNFDFHIKIYILFMFFFLVCIVDIIFFFPLDLLLFSSNHYWHFYELARYKCSLFSDPY